MSETSMDAGARAELAALRRRAYGRDADIAADPVASARLRELEDLLRLASAPPVPPADDRAAARTHADTADLDETATTPGPERGATPPPVPRPTAEVRRARRTMWLVTVGAAVAVVIAIAVSPALRGGDPTQIADPPESGSNAPAFEFAVPAGADLLIQVPIDGSFGSYRDLPDADVPLLPELGDVTWAEPLGEYYGYDLWIGAVVTADGEELCVIASATTLQDGSCGSRRDWEGGALVASVPYLATEPDGQPDGLAPGESLRFWWTPDDTVYVLRGVDALAADA